MEKLSDVLCIDLNNSNKKKTCPRQNKKTNLRYYYGILMSSTSNLLGGRVSSDISPP